MKKKILALCISTVLVLATAAGCAVKKTNSGEATSGDKVDIVTTIFPPYDFTKNVGGDNVNVTMLLKPGAESHTYEPTPADIKQIEACDLFIYTGGENDTWVDGILESIDTEKVQILKMVDTVQTVEEEIVEGMEHSHHDHEDGEQHDHEHGEHHEHEDGEHHDHEDGEHHDHEDGEHHDHEDGEHHDHEDGEHHDHENGEHHDHEDGEHHEHHHNEMDEHVWTSPKNAIVITNAIREELKTIDTANAATYDANADKYIEELTALDKDYTDTINASAKKTIVVGDRFPFRYLADAYGLKYYAAFTGCSSDTEAKPATIAFLIDKVKEENINTVFTIEMSDGKIADSICEATGAKKEVLHSAHNLSQEEINSGLNYIKLMRDNLAKLKVALN